MRADDDERWTAATRAKVASTADASAIAEDAEQLWLAIRVHGGRSTVRTATLPPGATLIGRAVPEGIRLADDRSSRIHASLVVDDEGVTVEDHRTKNGTFVDGVRVLHQARARDGSVLRFGDSVFVLRKTTPAALEDRELPGVIGTSPVARALRRQLDLLAPTDAWVLLVGDTGTGKEVAARALHERSGRKGPLVAVNCGAIPSELAEAYLFGHIKGAFTGADATRDGYFQAADGGTLFLDEIGELPLALQPKLLRALDERRVARVGETKARLVDVRVVAATLRDLGGSVATGAFRADLYARLSEVVLEVPPLRDRVEDVLLLLRHFLGDDKPLSADLAEALVLYRWPFNVREVAKLAGELRARGVQLPRYQLELVGKRLTAPTTRAGSTDRSPAGARVARSPAPSKDEVIALLGAHHGNVLEVARAAGRSRKQVYRWLKEHGLDPAIFRG